MWRLLVVILASLPVWAVAQKPDMTRQRTWGAKEKNAFYLWLGQGREFDLPRTSGTGVSKTGTESDSTAAAIDPPALLVNHYRNSNDRPVGQQTTFEAAQYVPGTLSNSYFSTRLGIYRLNELNLPLTRGAGDSETEADTTAVTKGMASGMLVGADLHYGRPIKTWFRQIYNLGLYQGSLDQAIDGGPDLAESFWLYRAGYHLELALVPLGLDQTRNILLRGGVDLFYGRGIVNGLENKAQKAQQQALFDQVEGLQVGMSWSLGYEKQLGENLWRLNAMLDGFKAYHVSRHKAQDELVSLGIFAGLSKAF